MQSTTKGMNRFLKHDYVGGTYTYWGRDDKFSSMVEAMLAHPKIGEAHTVFGLMETLVWRIDATGPIVGGQDWEDYQIRTFGRG